MNIRLLPQRILLAGMSLLIIASCINPHPQIEPQYSDAPMVDSLRHSPIGTDGEWVDEPPVSVSRVNPVYPPWALSKGQEGEVILRVEIDSLGVVQSIGLIKSDVDFNKAAVDAVYQWRFEPAMRNGKPIGCYMQVPISFGLN